jgi:phosphorylcholine metabolism protein LicD
VSYLYEEQKQALLEIHEVLSDNNFLQKCQIGFGTFLGAYRQKKLNTSLNNWDDLDFEILSENFEEFKTNILSKLLDRGFYLIHAHLVKTGEIGSLTIGRKKDRIDFQVIFENKNDTCYHFLWHGGIEMTKGFSKSYYRDIKKYELEGLLFYGPNQAKLYLKDMYGENWRVPCKSEDEYKFWEDSPGIPWKFKYKHYKLVRNKELKELLNVK